MRRLPILLGLIVWATACKEDPVVPTDWDEDGAALSADCDDRRASVGPDVEEVCDGLDNDCDGLIDENDATDAPTWYLDYDGDGYGGTVHTTACEAPTGWIATDGDCDDHDATIAPGVAWNEPSDACQQDADGDGWADAASESPLAAGTDCDDADDGVAPDQAEVCDGVDTDCDGVLPDDEADADADGYVSCTLVETRAAVRGDDCDDTDNTISPGAVEVCNETTEVDDDCNGLAGDATGDALTNTGTTFYRDADGDTYGALPGTLVACTAPDGWVANADDCDDSRDTVHPLADEICDTLTNNCDSDAEPDAGLDPCPAELNGTVVYTATPDGDTEVACDGTLTVSGTLTENLCPACDFTMNLTHSAPAWTVDGGHCDEVDGPGTIAMGFDVDGQVWLQFDGEDWVDTYTGTASAGTGSWTGTVVVDESDYTGGSVTYEASATVLWEVE